MTRVRVEGFNISLDGYGAGSNQGISNPLAQAHFWVEIRAAFRLTPRWIRLTLN